MIESEHDDVAIITNENYDLTCYLKSVAIYTYEFLKITNLLHLQ